MPAVFNRLNVTAGCLGFHDLDFGIETMQALMKKTAPTKWMLTNMVIPQAGTEEDCGDSIAELIQTHTIKNVQGCGRQVGFIGIAEKDWLEYLSKDVTEEIFYMDFIASASVHAANLKKDGCDIVIALTHMRLSNDVILARNVPEIDLILGGQDHMYETMVDEKTGVFVVKSGTDFEEFSDIQMVFDVPTQAKAF